MLPAEVFAFPGNPLGVMALPDGDVVLFDLKDEQEGLGTSPLINGERRCLLLPVLPGCT